MAQRSSSKPVSYEMMYILDPELTEDGIQRMNGVIRDRITGGGGVIEKDQPWGVRKLAYEIKKRQDGYYHVLEFRSPQTALPASLGTFIRTQPGVLRHMIIRVPKAKLLQEQRDAAEAARREKQAPPKPEPPQAAPSETGKPSAVEPATIESSPTEETSGPTSEPEVEETQSPEAQHEQPSWLETDEEGMQAEVEPDDAPDAPTR